MGWVIVRGAGYCLNLEGSFFFSPKFLSLVSFFGVRLSVRVRLGLGFELS